MAKSSKHYLPVFILALGSPTTTLADQWFVEPQASLRTFYEENTGLTVRDPSDSGGMIARAEVMTGKRTENSEIGIESAVERREYFSDAERSTTDFLFDLVGTKILERDRFSFLARLDLDSTLTSELETSGLITERKRRVGWSLRPSWRHSVTERLGVSTNASYLNVRYRDAEFTGLVDYKYTTFGLSMDYATAPLTQLIGRVDYYHYDPDRGSDDTKSVGLLFGGSHVFTEKWSLSAQAGLRRTKVGDTSETGNLVDVVVVRQLEKSRLEFALSRSLAPSGSGELLSTSTVKLDGSHRLTPRVKLLFVAEGRHNENSTSRNSSRGDRRYIRIEPRLRYELTKEWSITGGYRYRYQKYDAADDSADGNMLFATLSYRPLVEK